MSFAPAIDIPARLVTSKGFEYPSDTEQNRAWRIGLYEQARHDKRLQSGWMAAAKEDPELFFALFLWTFNTKVRPALTPFAPWPAQLEVIREIASAIEDQHDILVEKSRDVGLTWVCVGSMVHRFLFFDDDKLLMLSRTEMYVDSPQNADCLFWKVDYIVNHLPGWMRPETGRKVRSHMHYYNSTNRACLDGEATTVQAGRGGKRKAILGDEAAAVSDGDKMMAATGDNADCRIWNSTHLGTWTPFYKHRMSGKCKVLTVHWWISPVKAAGLYRADEDGNVEILDKSYKFPADYEFITKDEGKLRSPWYDREQARRSAQEMAQEIDINAEKAGSSFFDVAVLEAARKRDIRPPVVRGDLLWTCDLRTRRLTVEGFEKSKKGPGGRQNGNLSLWCPLDAWGSPPIDEDYVLGVDVATGDGSSNSVISIGATGTKEKVAEWAATDVSPEDLGRHVVALARWFHRAYVVWEANGPGGILGKEISELGYSYVYWQRDELAGRPKKGKRPGWFSTGGKKELLLADYRRALGRGEFVNRSDGALEEAIGYIWLPGGQLSPANQADLTTGARARHGDRVIADALCSFGMQEPRSKRVHPVVEGSYADRRQRARIQAKRAKEWAR